VLFCYERVLLTEDIEMEADDGSDGDTSSAKQREFYVFHNVAP